MQKIKLNKLTSIKIHLIGLLLIILFYGILDPVNALLFGGIVNFIIYPIIGYLEIKKDKLIFNPLSFYFLWYTVNLGLSAIYTSTVIGSEGILGFSIAHMYPEDVAAGFVIFTIGSFALHIGMQLNRPNKFNSQPLNQKAITKLAFISFVLLGLVFEFFNPYLSVLGGTLSFLRFAMISSLAIIAFNPNNFLKLNNSVHRNILILSSLAVFILNISTTSKSFMMFAFFPLGWYLLYNRIDKIKLIIILIFFTLLYLFFVFPLSLELRADHSKGRPLDVISSVENVITGKSQTFDFQVKDSNPIYAYLSRSFDAVAVAYLYTQVTQYGFKYGETMINMVYALVPRLLWPEKPNVSRASWFTYYIGFAPSPESATVALGQTATGELYWNFGIFGVIIGMFIVGICFAGLWRLAGLFPQYSLISMLLYINVLFGMAGISEFGSVITTFILTYIVFKSAYFIRDKINHR